MSTSTPLSSLAPEASTLPRMSHFTSTSPSTSCSSGLATPHVEPEVVVKTETVCSAPAGYQGYNWAWALIAFIILVIIIWLILWAVKPTWVQQTDPAGNCTGEIDNGKAFLWSVAIALVIIIIVWLIRAAAAAGGSC